ncbi:FKBP-type peptidyl-prolyl cis-trans isomerase N-terminal domain-containing protein [Kluyvera intermedia]|uniref:FKBP-type peptidyl-prolyl cis-trans isomerase N-terminal domain-containing protein n=1 Tax=Kluyvera intermedia TaxID=61648 RepID=UPI000787252E|nr:FKBP-type peptidyl-prolyl cis-trans isomerase N-terminal domain-containing protein [Kluyvera intermedia]WQD29265.1 FKBP-type peptidyl-prolyl cis-trans isomerase N-terminal domain-containing protein [Kluyvera intermedia]VDZ85061.1 FKBP-type peptidyl-prolyl cis-trans isomerase fkpA precursor [Kluyvera intermedia]
MTAYRHIPAPALIALGGALLLPPAGADDGIPALLQFADSWHQQRQNTSAAGEPEKPAAQEQKKADLPRQMPADLSVIRRIQQEADAQKRRLSQQSITLREQAQELAALRQKLRAGEEALAAAKAKINEPREQTPDTLRPLPELGLFRRTVVNIREALGGTPQEKAAASRLQEVMNMLRSRENELKASEEKTVSQASDLKGIEQQLQAKEEEANQMAVQSRLAEARLETLQLRRPEVLRAEDITTEEQRLSYAAGSALGADLLSVVEEREVSGVILERDVLLAGVTDAFQGQLVLPAVELAQILSDSEQSLEQTREARMAENRLRDEVYVNAFKKQKGVKRSTAGFWYRVEYAGDSPIPEDAVVDIVVKELLTDGTVVQDMELTQQVMSQPLSNYPPLFREAIGHLNNHGSLTMVVPPALAYGDEGYPPKVLPGATMVYELRVNDANISGSFN